MDILTQLLDILTQLLVYIPRRVVNRPAKGCDACFENTYYI